MSGPLRKVSQKYNVDLPLHLNNSLNPSNSWYVWHFPGLNPPWPSMAGRSWPMGHCSRQLCSNIWSDWKLSEIQWFVDKMRVVMMIQGYVNWNGLRNCVKSCNGRQTFTQFFSLSIFVHQSFWETFVIE